MTLKRASPDDFSEDDWAEMLGGAPKYIEDAVNAKLQEVTAKLQPHYPNKIITLPEVKYDLLGHTAGYAIGGKLIRLNLPIIKDPRHTEDMLNNTVPHEMCHIVDVQMHGKSSNHGYRWKYLMYTIGLEPTRCHNYETRPARIMPKDQIYYCSCGEHPVTIILHRRMQAGTKYTCRTCGTRLRESE